MEEFYIVYRSNKAGDTWKVQGVATTEQEAGIVANQLLQQGSDRTVRVLVPLIEFTSSVIVTEKKL